MEVERRRRRITTTLANDAACAEIPKMPMKRKRKGAASQIPNKILARDFDHQDVVMDDVEPDRVSDVSKTRKRNVTKSRMSDAGVNGSEEDTSMLSDVEDRKPSKKIRKLSEAGFEDDTCSTESDAMEVREDEEEDDEDVPAAEGSFCSAGDGKEREANPWYDTDTHSPPALNSCVQRRAPDALQLGIPIRTATYRQERELQGGRGSTEIGKAPFQRPVDRFSGSGVRSRENHIAGVVVRQCQECHKEVTVDKRKADQWRANCQPRLPEPLSSRYQRNRLALKNPPVIERKKGSRKTILFASIVILLCFLVLYLLLEDGYLNTGLVVPRDNVTTSFEGQVLGLQSRFPSQRAELWKRTKIHLMRNLKANQRKEPVSMILVSGLGAEKTLRCLAVHLAGAMSLALNVTLQQIDGAGRASQDSDQVKLDIDQELTEAFMDDKGAAVIHQFEELPPGSTLIFYKYCDHENAAYKNAFLLFTVLLPVEDLKPELSLKEVEQMVQGHIAERFLSSTQPTAFSEMDSDKLGGLWSRISHLVLPVSPEEEVEQNGCRI